MSPLSQPYCKSPSRVPQPLRSRTFGFIPLVFEPLGELSDAAADSIVSVGRLLGQRLGTPPSESTRHLFQRVLYITLWRGNAALWIRRCPPYYYYAPSVDGVASLYNILFLFTLFIFVFSLSLTYVYATYT